MYLNYISVREMHQFESKVKVWRQQLGLLKIYNAARFIIHLQAELKQIVSQESYL